MKPNARQIPARRVEAVVVGASAGGIEALLALLHGIPPPWRLPVVVVLHLPEGHQSHLAEIFAERLHMPVHEAADKMPIAPDSLYFAPPGYHLSIERDRCFSLSCEPPVHFSRPSIDVLMASAADAYGPALAGFLLTGANDDGAEGLLRIHMGGGITAVQDPEEAQIPTMPRAAIALHRPDHVLALRELRTLLLQLESAHAHH
ncbi:chemotaxis protein CheB [Variovorax sp. V59]|uniref:protein-glutamate methylesterase n=1 Tax=Variovorax paradoxus TaxID=34073 RepID=A0AAE3Y332_VARPD|nr:MULTISPECIES: chemotaxis protein CheB [Variovorax]MBD9665325.1 chemotaxis protein CheB [Variovorax sp. VRV01]MDP9966995.1 two-component system chemotaxis response regulator CheB [Variovorax paradoxus]MDR6429595.1 two-component system chemotaxis response regulator CheB [Variovorax paradoxus]